MEYVIVCVASVFVAGLTFFSGFGLGTLLMPVFAVFFPVEIAIAATAVVHLANNCFKVILAGRNAKMKVVLLFAIPGAIAAVLGALLLNYFATFSPLVEYEFFGNVYYVTPLKAAIAAMIIGIVVLEAAPVFKRLSFDAKFIPVGGVLSGFMGGLSGHQGALRTAFLVRAGLEKKELIGTMIVSAVVVDISRLVIYGMTFMQQDVFVLKEQGVTGLVIAGTLAAFAGSFVGSRLLEKVTLGGLKRLVAAMLILLGLAIGFGVA